jgi:hypothetical protein
MIFFYLYLNKKRNIMSECKSCQSKGPGKGQIGTIILGFVLLGTSIYGMVQIVKDIIGLIS